MSSPLPLFLGFFSHSSCIPNHKIFDAIHITWLLSHAEPPSYLFLPSEPHFSTPNAMVKVTRLCKIWYIIKGSFAAMLFPKSSGTRRETCQLMVYTILLFLKASGRSSSIMGTGNLWIRWLRNLLLRSCGPYINIIKIPYIPNLFRLADWNLYHLHFT